MKVLVTGSTGFLGSHLCQQLTKDGHKVYAQARSEIKFDQLKINGELILGDLKSLSWVDHLPNDLDCVIHTAGIVHSFNTPEFYRVNGRGCRNLVAKLAGKFANLRFIQISSMSAIGPSAFGEEKLEDVTPGPVSHYGWSKLEGEMALKKIGPKTWQKIYIRPPMILGPGDPAFLDLFKMVKSGLVMQAGKNKKISFISVHDLVQVISKTLNKEINGEGEIYHPACPDHLTLGELIGEISKVMNKKMILNIPIPRVMLRPVANSFKVLNKLTTIDFRLTPDKVDEIIPDAWLISPEKTKTDLAMEFKWGLKRSIEDTYQDYSNRGWI